MMKSKIYKAAIMVVSVFCAAGLHGQEQQNTQNTDTLRNALALSIEITTENNANLRGATVKIYQNDKFIAELNNKLQPNIIVTLEKNSFYVMKVEKQGYESK